MRIFTLVSALALAAAVSACGHNTEQRAATGAVAGAVVAGPVGAVAGGAVGAMAGPSVSDTVQTNTPRTRRR